MRRFLDINYLKRVAGYIAAALAAVILIIDIAYQLTGAMVNSVETMPVSTVKEDRLITSDGYIVRTETPIAATSQGIVSHTVADGTKVAAGDSVAEIFGDSPQQAQQLASLQRALRQQALLKEAYAKKNSYSQTSADREIAQLTTEINRLTAKGDTRKLPKLTDSLQVMLYIREIKTGKDLSEAQTAIENEIAIRKEQVGGSLTTIRSDRSGYYYGSCDGYESYLTVSELKTAEPAVLQELLDKKTEPQNTTGLAGKIVTDYTWCVVMQIPFQTAQALSQGKTYTVLLSGLDEVRLSMKLERTIPDYDSDSTMLIFSCTEQPQGFSYSRYQTVSVVLDNVEGYRLPVGALRMLDGITGVYVLKGSVIEFREVSPMILSDGTVLADASAEPTGEYSMLNYYDVLIIQGKELYVGKIVHQ